VIEGDRVDLLAHRYLGQADLWWIICDYNDLFFPLELTPGTILRIPSTEHVSMRLLDSSPGRIHPSRHLAPVAGKYPVESVLQAVPLEIGAWTSTPSNRLL